MIKGKAGATVEFILLAYSGNGEESPRKITLLPVKIMKDDQLIETSFEFDPSEYGVSGKFFRLLLSVHDGEAYFDDVTVVNR